MANKDLNKYNNQLFQYGVSKILFEQKYEIIISMT